LKNLIFRPCVAARWQVVLVARPAAPHVAISQIVVSQSRFPAARRAISILFPFFLFLFRPAAPQVEAIKKIINAQKEIEESGSPLIFLEFFLQIFPPRGAFFPFFLHFCPPTCGREQNATCDEVTTRKLSQVAFCTGSRPGAAGRGKTKNMKEKPGNANLKIELRKFLLVWS